MGNSVQIRLDPHGPKYVPGEKIKGQIVLLAESSLNTSSVLVVLCGTCATRALCPRSTDDERRNRGRDELMLEDVPFLFQEVVISSEAKTYAPGRYMLDFEFTISDSCTNPNGLNAQWRGLPLPSSVSEDIHPDGRLFYDLTATVRTTGLFSRNVKEKREINIQSQQSLALDPLLVTKKKFVQQQVDVQVYDSDVEKWSNWGLRLLGIPTATATIPYKAKLVHTAVGLPMLDIPLNEVASLTILKTEQDDKKVLDIEIEKLEIFIVYFVSVTAKNSTAYHTVNVPLIEGGFTGQHELLHFVDGKADLTHLLKDAKLTPRMAAVVTPNLTIKPTLRVNLGLNPTVGSPIKAVYAKLESDVNIYWCPPEQTPVLLSKPDETPPPYEV